MQELINYQPIDITKERLLQSDEEVTFIVPITHKDIYLNEDTITFDNKEQCWHIKDYLKEYSPLQKDQSFYVGEEFVERSNKAHYKDSWPKYHNVRGLTKWMPSDQMQPHQSRDHFDVVDVECMRIDNIKLNICNKLITSDKAVDSLTMSYFFETYLPKIVSQHNQLHQTNIEPSMDDYVFYVTVKRTK